MQPAVAGVVRPAVDAIGSIRNRTNEWRTDPICGRARRLRAQTSCEVNPRERVVMGIVVFGFFWVLAVLVLPIWVGYRIGARKGRAGWAWGLFLGWLGVLIVALLSNKNSEHGGFTTNQQLLADREYEARLEELRRRRAGLQS